MDSRRFDRFARLLATGSSRRDVIRRGGAVGVAVALGGAFREGARAQDATPTAETSVRGGDGRCLVPFEVSIRQGPSAGFRAQGVMAIVVDETGHLDGTFLFYDGTEVPVSGQATGRAVTLIVSLPNGGRLYGTGGADADVVSCAFTDMGGSVVGPQPGDFGDWVVLKKRHLIPDGSVCFLGDPDCPPDLGPVEPTPTGGGGYSTPDPCESEAYKSCPDLCMRSGLSSDCDTYCAETFFCN